MSAAMQADYDRYRAVLPPWMRQAVDARASELGLRVVTEECGLETAWRSGKHCCLPVGHWQAHHWQGDDGGSIGWLDDAQWAASRASEVTA